MCVDVHIAGYILLGFTVKPLYDTTACSPQFVVIYWGLCLYNYCMIGNFCPETFIGTKWGWCYVGGGRNTLSDFICSLTYIGSLNLLLYFLDVYLNIHCHLRYWVQCVLCSITPSHTVYLPLEKLIGFLWV